MIPAEAHVIVMHGGTIHDMPLKAVKPDSWILVRPGEKIPVDGTVLKGESYLNESMLTGESAPVLKQVGAKVIVGELNGNGSLEIKIQQTGKELTLPK